MKKIALITPGVLPLPAVKGGAVETLIDGFLKNKNNDLEIDVFSIYDKKIENFKSDYKRVKFIYYKGNILLTLADRIISFLAHIFLKNKNMVTFNNLSKRYFYLRSIKRRLIKENYDLVILENHCAELIPFKNKKIYNKYFKKVIYHSHNKPAHYKPFLKYFNVINTFYSVSDSLTKKWKEEMKPFNVDVRFETLLNGVDTTIFKPLKKTVKNRFNLDTKKKTILFAGRMTKDKGIFEVIDAFKMLNFNKYQLLIVGDLFYDTKVKNNEQNLIYQKIKSLGSNCKFIGFVPHCEMPFVYNAADIIVLPSTGYDSAPLALLEAICSCKPIISTNNGGIPEYSKNKGVLLLDLNPELSKNIYKMILKLENNEFYNKCCNKSLQNYISLDINQYYNSLNLAIYANIKS